MNRRSDIISRILQSAFTGASKVKIMYDAYLSYGQVKEYLSFLEENGWIGYDMKTHHYTITTKGKKMLKHEQVDDLTTKEIAILNEMEQIRWY